MIGLVLYFLVGFVAALIGWRRFGITVVMDDLPLWTVFWPLGLLLLLCIKVDTSFARARRRDILRRASPDALLTQLNALDAELQK